MERLSRACCCPSTSCLHSRKTGGPYLDENRGVRTNAWRYVAAVCRQLGRHVSGWVPAVIGIASLVFTAILIYRGADPALINKVSVGTAAVLVLAIVFLIQAAQYDAWEVERGARVKIQSDLDSALKTGPEVSLSFQQSGLFTGFIVENRSNEKDVSDVSIDPFETARYRAFFSASLPSLHHGGPPHALPMRMTDKIKDIEFVDLNLGEMLDDSSVGFQCSLCFTLRYSDAWGNRFKRGAHAEIDKLGFNMDRLPPIVNHAIEWDRDQRTA